MAKNKSLTKARKAKNDEFYTQLADIENEVRYYKEQFKGQVVFCNCDDPYESNFVKYFILNFNRFGLKKLIATCYGESKVAGSEFRIGTNMDQQCLWEDNTKVIEQKHAYKIEITEVYDLNGDGAIDLLDAELLLHQPGVVTELNGNGDFRSDECLALLDMSDICCTNPPFSIEVEYISTVLAHGKKFLVIGDMNKYKNKDLFPSFMQGKFWAGYNSRAMTFIVPKDTGLANVYLDETDGKLKAQFGNILWYTNLDVEKRHEELVLYKTYTKEDYPKYDTYDAINVDKIVEIPSDYTGIMGVPESFIDKHNPEQFEIVGILNSGSSEFDYAVPKLNGKTKFTRLLIKHKQ